MVGQRGGHIGRGRCAQDARKVETQGRTGVAHRRREQLGQPSAQGAIGPAHQRQPQPQKLPHAIDAARAKQRRDGKPIGTDRQADGNQHATPTHAISDRSRQRDAQSKGQHRLALQAQEHWLGQMQARGRGRAPGQGEDGHQVEQHKGAGRCQSAQQQGRTVMGKDVCDGHAHALVLLQSALKQRRLSQAQAHEQAQDHQQGAAQEGHAPSPSHELLRRQALPQPQEHTGGDEKPQGCAQLWKHAVPGATMGGGVFCGQQDRSAPLATQAQALAKAAQGQQRRRGHAHAGIGWQQTDGHR